MRDQNRTLLEHMHRCGQQLNGRQAPTHKGEGGAEITGPASGVVTNGVIRVLEVIDLNLDRGDLLPVINPFRVHILTRALGSGLSRPWPLGSSTRNLLRRLLEEQEKSN